MLSTKNHFQKNYPEDLINGITQEKLRKLKPKEKVFVHRKPIPLETILKIVSMVVHWKYKKEYNTKV